MLRDGDIGVNIIVVGLKDFRDQIYRLSQEYEIQDEKTWTASALKEKSLPNVCCD